MPENWTILNLNEIAEVIDSLHKTPKYSTSGYPMVRAQEIVGGNLNLEGAALVSKEVFDDFSRNHTPKIGDLVFSRVGAHCGKTSFVNTKTEFCLGQNTVFIVPKGIDNKLLYYILSSPSINEQIQRNAVVSSYKTISLKTLRELEISFPKEEKEQKSIASILSALDDKIELNLQMNKTLEEMAMALYKHWFVDFGPFQDREFVDSELGEIPKIWEVKLLNELGNIFYGKMPKKDKLQNEGFPVYSGYRNVGFYPIYNCDKGKVIVVARGVGGTGDVKMTSEKCFLTNLSICISNEFGHIDDNLLFFGLKRNGLDYLRTGSAQPQITINDLNSVSVLIPPKETQADFLSFFKPLLLQMDYNLQENKTLTQLRDTLLPKLISGEVRVKDAEKTLSEVL